MVNEPDVLALRDKAGGAVVDPDMAEGTARVSIRLADGTVLEKTILDARGSLEAPLSAADIDEKLRRLASHGAPGVDPDAVLAALADLPHAATSRDLMAVLRPSTMR